MNRHLIAFIKLFSILLVAGFLNIFIEHWAIYLLALSGILLIVLKTYSNDI